MIASGKLFRRNLFEDSTAVSLHRWLQCRFSTRSSLASMGTFRDELPTQTRWSLIFVAAQQLALRSRLFAVPWSSSRVACKSKITFQTLCSTTTRWRVWIISGRERDYAECSRVSASQLAEMHRVSSFLCLCLHIVLFTIHPCLQDLAATLSPSSWWCDTTSNQAPFIRWWLADLLELFRGSSAFLSTS